MFHKLFDYIFNSLKFIFIASIVLFVGYAIYNTVYYYNNPDELNEYITSINEQYKLDSIALEKQTYYDYKDVPNQREINDIWVSNPHGIINKNEVYQIDTLVKGIEKRTSYEIAVVLLNDISDYTPFDFGLELFNYWGIGKKETNNGLLILVIKNQRNLTFVTGSGTELVLPDLMTKQIGDEKMKPFFREDEYAKGLVSGITVIGQIFNNQPTDYNSSSKWIRRLWYVIYIYVGLLLITFLLFIIKLTRAIFIKDFYKRYNFYEQNQFNFLRYPFPLPFYFLSKLHDYLIDKWRYASRFSKKNGAIMKRVWNQEKNKYLSDGQIKEDEISSLKYDVWVTNDESDILILSYKGVFGYSKCPKCKFKTVQRNIQYSNGLTAILTCQFCDYKKTEKQFNKNGSSGSSFSSSSSSSSSSWSGGSSSGGGSSSSW